MRQVQENTESTKRQYALKDKLVEMGWDLSRIEVIDNDLGRSGADTDRRHGFQYLVSEVSLGHAGIIAGTEVSRLSRSSVDWGRLLEISALTNTLIMDEEGIYNANDINDRMLLGMKGTLFEMELHYIKSRLRGGLLNKAKRGELKRPLQIGYVYDDNGQIAKDPNAQVQEAVSMFFNTFKRVGSVRSLIREYKKQGLLFPYHPRAGFKMGELTWQEITNHAAVRMLKNPTYAGIYVYGVRQVKHTVKGQKHVAVPRESYHAWLPGSHPAYISEAQYEENISQLAKNARPKPDIEHGGAVREGPALLQGISICGKCGKKMSLRYKMSKGATQPIYMCQFKYIQQGGKVCQSVNGFNIDLTIEGLLLETINPITTDAAIAVQREITQRKDEILRIYGQQMERARYEMDLSKRRYFNVDPNNHLVADELEHDWELKINEYESAKMAYEQKSEEEVRAVDEKLKRALEQLVSDFSRIWNDPKTSHKEKKRIARLILEDVTITSNPHTVTLGIRFKSGATKVMEFPNTSRDLKEVKIRQGIYDEIKTLLPLGYSNQKIAEILYEKGYKTKSSGKPFTAQQVAGMLRNYGIPTRKELAMSDGSWLTGKQKMAELGISEPTLRRMRINGKVIFKTYNLNGIAYLYKPQE